MRPGKYTIYSSAHRLPVLYVNVGFTIRVGAEVLVRVENWD